MLDMHATEHPRGGFTALGIELDALRKRTVESLGERDARHIHRMVAIQRGTEISGRLLLFAGVLPPAWLLGASLLGISKILENMEIGHNVMHGQYDWMNEPRLSGRHYEWDNVCPADDWRHTHNFMHHTFTNVVGKDRDVGYGFLRVSEEQPWHLHCLAQPVTALGLMLIFQWGVALHPLRLDEIVDGSRSLRQALRDARPFFRKASRQLLKDYLAYPLLAGPFAPFVSTGNFTANLIRNIWTFLVIFCGHFPEGVAVYDAGRLRGESRGAWYERQIRGSANIEGPRWFHVLTGHLSHQIEHHLFPDIPAHRYPEIAPEVRAICQRHGIAYTTGSFGRELASVARRLCRLALPGPSRKDVQHA